MCVCAVLTILLVVHGRTGTASNLFALISVEHAFKQN